MSYENTGIGRWLSLTILHAADTAILKLSHFSLPNKNTNNVRIKNRLATYIYDVQEVKTVVKYRNDDRSTSRSLIINSKDKKTKYIKI